MENASPPPLTGGQVSALDIHQNLCSMILKVNLGVIGLMGVVDTHWLFSLGEATLVYVVGTTRRNDFGFNFEN